MFREHFENIVPFSEFILVLLQAYGFIISTSVWMFYIHACQCLLRGTRSSACKMGEQAVWAFTMDDRCRHDRTGDTICGADGFRIPCHAWWFRGGHQHSRLYALFFAYLHGNLQHRDHTFQPQKDDTDVQWHFILWLAVLAMPIAIFSTTLLYIVGPAVLLALLFFNLTFIALGSSYVPTEELLDKEEENNGSSRTRYMRSGGYRQVLAKKARSFQPSVDSLVALIFTESSRQKKAVLLQNGETSTLQMQHKMVQIEHNLLFVKYQRKSKIFYKKQPKRCRIPTK